MEGPLGANALRILRDIPGIAVQGLDSQPPDQGVDAILRFAGIDAGIAVEIKQRANAATAWQLVERAKTHPDFPLLLIATETTSQARAILQEHGVAVVDANGNAHIELPGLLFHIEGRGHPPRTITTRLSGKAGIAVQLLLLHPERAWHVTDLARKAGVSAGLAHRVMARLEAEGIATTHGSGPNRVRHLTNPGALLDLWVEEQEERRLRTPAHLLAQTPQQLIRMLAANLAKGDIDYALTGAAGGSILAPFASAIPVVEVWVKATAAPEEVCEAAQAERVSDGQNVIFLQAGNDGALAFRQMRGEVSVANRFRVYADLHGNPRRGREQADHLRREVIGF